MTDTLGMDSGESPYYSGLKTVPEFIEKDHWLEIQGKRVPKKTPYEILGVSNQSSDKTIQSAYTSLKNGYTLNSTYYDTDSNRKNSEKWLELLATAKTYVNTQKSRKYYDTLGYIPETNTSEGELLPKYREEDWYSSATTKDFHSTATSKFKKSLYDILGVPKNASAKDIQKVFEKLAHKFHPDKNPDDPNAQGWFKLYNSVYEILSDPEKKAEYDKTGSTSFRIKVEDSDLHPGDKILRKMTEERSDGAEVGPLWRFGSKFGDYDGSIGKTFRGISNEDLNSAKLREAYSNSLDDYARRQAKLDAEDICGCDTPIYPIGYGDGRGKPRCHQCGKPLTGSKREVDSLTSGTPEIGTVQ